MAWSFEAKIIETIFNALEAVICSTAVYFLYADKVKESDILGKYSCYIWILIFSYLYTIRNMMTMVLIAYLKLISTLSCRSALEYDHCYSQSHLNQSDFRFTSLSNTRCSLSLSYEWNERKISFRQVIDIMFFFYSMSLLNWHVMRRVFFVTRCVRLNDVILSESVNHSSFSFMISKCIKIIGSPRVCVCVYLSDL